MKTWPSKDPDEQLDYTYDWAPDLAVGETLVSHTFVPIDAAGTVVATENLLADKYVVWFTGGTDGDEATYTLQVTTSQNRILEDTVVLPIIAKSVAVDYPGGYVAPTVGNLLAAFPEFSAVPPSQIAYALSRAARSVDTSWLEGDFGHARMLLAAHYMTMSGLGTSAEAASIRSGSDQFKSMGIASLSLVRFDRPGGSSGRATFASTAHGREFARLLRQNKAGPRVAGTLSAGWGDGDNYGPWTA